MRRRVLAVRHDNNGDVLLTGPALRAIARSASVTLLCGPRGSAAARLLPGVDDVLAWEAPWIDPDPRPVDPNGIATLVAELRRRGFDEAVVFTSFHQSALPTALLLRMAGVGRIGAISVDYPGSLLDVRHRVADDIHEVERNLSLARAMGYEPAADDSGALRVAKVPRTSGFAPRSYVVVHPGCTMPARAWSAEGNAALVRTLARHRYRVVITGTAQERALCERVAGDTPFVTNVAGRTSFPRFAAIVRDAAAVVSGNTVAPHLAASFGTPVVSIFPPTIPAVRFRPWMVDHALLGDQGIACAGCRARVCPVEGHPCLRDVTPQSVVASLESLLASRARRAIS